MKRILSGAVAAVSVLSLTAVAFVPTVSADLTQTVVKNGKIVFQSNRDGNNEIYVMDADGNNQTDLTNDNTASDTSPVWSPDGTRILYSSDRSGSAHFEYYTMKADGTDKQAVTTTTGTAIAAGQFAAWSPDGTKVYYAATNSYGSGNGSSKDLYYQTVNSSGIPSGSAVLVSPAGEQVGTPASINENGPSISPDGTKIAFLSDRDGSSNVNIWTAALTPSSSGTPGIIANSSDIQRVTLTSGVGVDLNQLPVWSHDGKRIYFNFTTSGDTDIFWSASDGSSSSPNDVTTSTASTDETGASITPEGTLLFSSDRSGGRDIFSAALDGSNPTDIGTHAGSDSNPSQQLTNVNPLSCVAGTPLVCTVPVGTTVGPYTIDNNEVLIVNGTSGNVIINSGGYLQGTGTVGTITSNSGGHVSPGPRPGAGCLTAGNTSLTQGSFFDEEIAGTTPCDQYDQLKVNGTVSLGNATLNVTHLNGFKSAAGNSFTIIDNDGSDAVSGTFNGLAEGATFSVDGVTYRISYVGGDGNDVVLSVVTAPGTPDTGLVGSFSNPLVILMATTGSALALFYLARRFA